MRKRTRQALIAFLVAWPVAACDLLGPEDDGPKGPGAFHATLVSPAGDEGSAVIELVGGFELSTISPEEGQAFYRHEGGTTRLVMILEDPGTIRFQVRTEDVSRVPTAMVIQVGDPTDQLRGSLAGYSVELEKVPDPTNGWERE